MGCQQTGTVLRRAPQALAGNSRLLAYLHIRLLAERSRASKGRLSSSLSSGDPVLLLHPTPGESAGEIPHTQRSPETSSNPLLNPPESISGSAPARASERRQAAGRASASVLHRWLWRVVRFTVLPVTGSRIVDPRPQATKLERLDGPVTGL